MSAPRASRIGVAALGWALAHVLCTSAAAQGAYPSKPIKIIAPVQPGGGVDLVARTIGERIGKALGQPVVVENQSGGGGIVGSQATARAAADGYTLMVGYVGTHGTNPAVRKLPYDAIRDFTPVAMVGGTPNVLVVPPSLPPTTLPEFLAYAKANRGKLSYGSSGPGTLTHLAMEQLKATQTQRGLMMIDLIARGDQCHAAYAQERGARSAVLRLAEDLLKLPTLLRERPHPLLAQPTITPTVLEAGVARNMTPPSAKAVIDLRTTPRWPHDELPSYLQAQLQSEVCVTSSRLAPCETPAGSRLLATAQALRPSAIS
jgi:hypothetical protein